MKKKRLMNTIMVTVILLIVILGVLGVGHIQGWFDEATENTALLTDIRGIVNLERDGVSFLAEDDTVLRAGDKITCSLGGTASIYIGDQKKLALDDRLEVVIVDPTGEGFTTESKQIVVEEESSAEESSAQEESSLMEESSITEDSSVPEENSSVPEEDSSVPEEDSSVPEEDSSVPEEDSSVPEEDSSVPEENSSVTEENSSIPEEDSSVPEENSSVPEEDSSVPEEDSSVPEESSADETPTYYCTLTIRCDTILNNWDNLDPAKAGYVPSDGIILYYATVAFTPGESVFDVLQRTCANYGIQLEYSWTPMYDSYYIEGINNLYEFDCGGSSGWMYKVNGWFPNYGCSSYPLSDGDDIVWCYTCVGLGEDVGA